MVQDYYPSGTKGRLTGRIHACARWVISGRDAFDLGGLFYSRKRTFAGAVGMSALRQKQTWITCQISMPLLPEPNIVLLPDAVAGIAPPDRPPR